MNVADVCAVNFRLHNSRRRLSVLSPQKMKTGNFEQEIGHAVAESVCFFDRQSISSKDFRQILRGVRHAHPARHFR